jgi:hypothetical protein
MGTLRSASDCRGMEVNAIILGEFIFTDEIDKKAAALFAWDDSRLPDGEIADDGEIIVDESELM